MRPTGKLHLGHYVGSLENRVALQEDYDCYFILANVHAFTKHPGLKDSDTRRKWKEEYYPIFSEAYLYLAGMEGSDRLQNLGEGLDYNIGTPISKKYFPLKKEVYERIK